VPEANRRLVKERTGARIFLIGYPIAVALGLAVHPEPLPVDGFLSVPLLWPLAVFFRRFKATASGLEIETAEVKEDLTTAVAAIEEKTPPKALTAGTEAELPAEQRSVTLTGGTLNITGGFITAEATASPRSDVVDFLVSDDPAVQLAALRIAIERELRGAAELAHLPATPATRPLPLKRLLTELVRHELLPDDLAVPLARVIDVANRAIHGAPIEPGADNVVADLGPRLIDGLRRLPSTSSWRAALVRARAGEQTVRELPPEELSLDDSEGLAVGDVHIRLLQTLRTDAGERRDIIWFAGTPPGPKERSVPRDDLPLAWIQGRSIVGTPSAKAMAPWLIDDVVEIAPPPEPPELH
jgi:hypothetical protein